MKAIIHIAEGHFAGKEDAEGELLKDFKDCKYEDSDNRKQELRTKSHGP
jgi:hypothetical protein